MPNCLNNCLNYLAKNRNTFMLVIDVRLFLSSKRHYRSRAIFDLFVIRQTAYVYFKINFALVSIFGPMYKSVFNLVSDPRL